MRFWLRVSDFLPFGSRVYLWVIGRASDCVVWE
jgi:hypothetical protein